MRSQPLRLRTPRSTRRLVSALRRTDDPDVSLLHKELEVRDRHIRELNDHLDRLQMELEEKRAESEALRRVGEATGSMFDSESMLRVTADIAVQITGTDSCQIYLFDPHKEELVLRAADESGASMLNKIRLKLGEGITGWVAQHRKPVAVSKEAWKDHRFKFYPEMQEGEYESMLSVPLVTRDDILGVINVRTRRPHEYTKNQIRLLAGIASQVAGSIKKSRRFRQLEKHAIQLHTLSEVSQAITSNLYLDEMLHLFVNLTAETMGYKICTVMLVDKDKSELVIKATQTDDKQYLGKPNLKIGESISGRVAAEGAPMSITDLQQTPEYRFPDIAKKAGLRSMASIPLIIKNEVIGVMNCYTAKLHAFTPEEIAILQALGTQAALAVEHAKLMVKSAVIQEMHHRVKNNLQQIVSLVRLEMRFARYTTVEDALNDTLNRILAIANVHELLSRDDLDSVSIKKLAENLVIGTQQSVVPSDKSIHVAVEGDDFLLPLNKATSMALTLNELIQNAVEHGFRTLNEGRILIRLSVEDDAYRVVVLNDGELLPEGFTVRSSDSLGLSIVGTLVSGDLQGTFTLENAKYDPGIVAVVTVPR